MAKVDVKFNPMVHVEGFSEFLLGPGDFPLSYQQYGQGLGTEPGT